MMNTTILVAEDSNTQRQMITKLLKNERYSVTTAKDGRDALAKVPQVNPDLIVLDIIMPEMNGYEVCRHLKGDSKTKQIPVIFCSSKDTEIDRYWGLKQGADAYIVKPFQPQDLLETVKQLCAFHH